MEFTKENIEGLKNIGFKEIKKETYSFMDVKAIVNGGYIGFKYDGKNLPIISKIESVEKIIQGIYEYKFTDTTDTTDDKECKHKSHYFVFENNREIHYVRCCDCHKFLKESKDGVNYTELKKL